MGKVLLVVLITLILLNATQAKGKRARKSKRNSTDIASPRTFRGHGIPVNVPPPPNRTTDPQTHVLPSAVDVEVKLRSNNTANYLQGPLSNRFIPAVYIIAIIVGIPANIAILVSLGTKVRVISSAILYCSLAASDLLLLFSLLLKTHYHLSGNHWIFGEAACRITTACFYGNLYCSAFTLACISIKRYLAVVHPFLYKSLPKRSFSTWGCLTVWIVFIIALLPEFLVQQSYRITDLGIITCHDVLLAEDQWLVYYNLGLTCVGFFLPLVVTVACYTSIIWHLNRSHRDWALYIRASTFNFIIFVLCFSPSSCLHFVHYLLLSVGSTESFYIYFSVTVCLCCLHSALDPYLFVLMSRTVGTKRYFLTRKGRALSISA
ncbi:proteinase-activated receptor 3 [Sinocyclocheilus rhinocerous]|uniref:proteinase-activated receptor 3 n=1 Tax=Sinocyclocheilus rhinocerous TaxID=307959 RepID=UPI0007BA8DE5|nr:PREDICTED: proteinase-activated receptor 3-like [Sinocyclocheilus rhinocerous]